MQGVDLGAALASHAVLAVARGAARTGSKAVSSADGTTSSASITAESSDDSWGKAGRDPDFRDLAQQLNALNQIPLDVNAVGALLMKHASPAGPNAAPPHTCVFNRVSDAL